MATYKYNDNVQLTPHLNCSEFRCKCGNTHNFTVNDKLPVMLEKVVNILGADHIYISSGYRCPTHDRAVGGAGYGQHTYGNASDFALEKDGKLIDSRVIACVAQEVGFGGIGRITSNYIHCDVRTSNIWYGDELAGATNYSLFSAPQTYWNYYGIDRSKYIGNSPVKDSSNDSAEVAIQKLLNSKGSTLDVDGIVGNLTLTEARKYSICTGDSGQLVEWVQKRLKSLGYDAGEIDGQAGEKTMSAIHQFQKDNKLGIGDLNGGDWSKLLL